MESLFHLQPDSTWYRSLRVWVMIFLVILVIAVPIISARRFRTEASRAEREVLVFRELFSNEQYMDIYISASEILRRQIGADQFVKRLSTIHERMGGCVASRPSNSFAMVGTSGTRVRLQYVTRCKNGALQETFMYIATGSNLQLAHYDASVLFQ